jgi:hypothetical protein
MSNHEHNALSGGHSYYLKKKILEPIAWATIRYVKLWTRTGQHPLLNFYRRTRPNLFK